MLARTWPCIALTACAAAAAPAPRDAESVLRAQTQELLDAIALGKADVWDRYLDPQIVYVGEDGTVETKASLLAQLKPLPAGISGSIAIGKLVVKQHGDVAIVMHVDDEHENYFGHAIEAQYTTTATWHYRTGGWKLVATQVLANLRDPPSITLPVDQLAEYEGTYKLTDAISYTIRRDGDALVGERTDRKPQPLRVEARDVLFVPGQPRSRKVMLRDATGRVTGFVDRREARDVPWTRVR